jgi:hypothetical protein
MTPSPNRIVQTEEYLEWLAAFEASRSGKMALDALGKLNPNIGEPVQKRLREEVLLACYQSVLFALDGDINSEKRDLLRDISNFEDPLTDHIEALIGDISFLAPIHDALVTEGILDFFPNPKKKQLPTIDHLLMHLELLKAGVRRFQDNLETHDVREECWVDGNMRYPKRIDRDKQFNKAKPSTCLMYHLAVYFRLWTHPDGQQLFDTKLRLKITSSGIAIPIKGRRSDKVIALFVEASFSDPRIREKAKTTEITVRGRLEKVDKGIKLNLWNDNSFDVITIPAPVIKKLVATGKIKTRTQKI